MQSPRRGRGNWVGRSAPTSGRPMTKLSLRQSKSSSGRNGSASGWRPRRPSLAGYEGDGDMLASVTQNTPLGAAIALQWACCGPVCVVSHDTSAAGPMSDQGSQRKAAVQQMTRSCQRWDRSRRENTQNAHFMSIFPLYVQAECNNIKIIRFMPARQRLVVQMLRAFAARFVA